MYKNVIIEGTGIYVPKKVVQNDYYINHFKKYNKDISSFLEKIGRKERHIADKDLETPLTMANKAAQNALNDAGISAEDLNAIIFASDTPEYLVPCNALILNHQLNAINAHTVYDLNSNCTGMIVALDQISRYMKTSDNIKYALVTSGLMTSSIARPDDQFIYPTTGDAGAAVVLKCVTEDTPRGILDSKYTTDSTYYDKVKSPVCGMTKARSNDVDEYDRLQQWKYFPIDGYGTTWASHVNSFKKEYNFSNEAIQYFFISQYSKQFLKQTASALEIDYDKDKFIFVGDQFGYTGSTSPFLALHKAIHDNPGKENYYAAFCSVAAGVSLCSLLYKF